MKQDIPSAEVKAVQISIEEFAERPEWALIPSGIAYWYFGTVITNIASPDVSSAQVEFKVLKSWVDKNEIDERTIRLLRWQGSSWEKLSTNFLREDPEYLYFEASMEGLSLFAVVGEKRAPGLPLLPLALFSIFGVGAGAYVVYRMLRPSKTVLMLRRLERAVFRPVTRRPLSKEEIKRLLLAPHLEVPEPVSRSELEALEKLKIIAAVKRKRPPERVRKPPSPGIEVERASRAELEALERLKRIAREKRKNLGKNRGN